MAGDDQHPDASPEPGTSGPADSAPASGGSLLGDSSEVHSTRTRTRSRGSSKKRRSFVRRHKALTALLALFALLAVIAVGGIVYVQSKLGQIDHVDVAGSLPEAERPDKVPGEALNVLMAGVDNGEGPSIAESVESVDWEPGLHRSDTIMLLHISGDRQSAYVVSIPRDTYTTIYDEKGQPAGKHKINAAFSLYGPAAYVSTIEHLTGIRMDHLAIIDWDGFKALTDALGGVLIYIPETVTEGADVTWSKGYQYMYGEEALRYVRTRHGLAGGDFDRIRRQQNFIRSLMSDLLEKGTLGNPLNLASVLDAVTRNLTVDDEWSSGDLRGLAFSMRGLRTNDVTFLSAPLATNWNQSISGEGDVVLLDKKQCSELWKAIANDKVGAYAEAHRSDQLPNERSVN